MSELTGEINKTEVHATSLKSGRTARINIDNPVPLIPVSTEAEMFSVNIQLQTAKGPVEAGSFVIRDYTFGESDNLDKYVKHYEFLQKNKFPVPTTVRRIEGEPALLITDLRMKDKTVFSWNEINGGRIGHVDTIANLPEVEEEIHEIARRAEELSVVIDQAAYFVIWDPQTKNADVILGDLGEMLIPGEEDSNAEFPTTSKEQAEHFIQLLRIGTIS